MTSSLAATYFCMSTVRSNPAPVMCHLSAYQASTLHLLWYHSAVVYTIPLSSSQHPSVPVHKGVYTLSKKCPYGGLLVGRTQPWVPQACSFACTRVFCSIQLGWKCLVMSLNSPFAVVCWFSFSFFFLFSLAIVSKFVIQYSFPPKWQSK